MINCVGQSIFYCAQFKMFQTTHCGVNLVSYLDTSILVAQYIVMCTKNIVQSELCYAKISIQNHMLKKSHGLNRAQGFCYINL